MGEPGRCRRRVVRFGKRAARFLGPILGGLVPQAVAGLEAIRDVVHLDGHHKRKAVILTVKAKAKELGHAAYDATADALTAEAEGYVRAHIESSLSNLRSGAALEDLQSWAEGSEAEDSEDD